MKYRPISFSQVKDRQVKPGAPRPRDPEGKEGGFVCWKDGGGSTWTVDPLVSTCRCLVWVNGEKQIIWQRRPDKLDEISGVWKASDGSRVTITDKVKLNDKALATGGGITFTP